MRFIALVVVSFVLGANTVMAENSSMIENRGPACAKLYEAPRDIVQTSLPDVRKISSDLKEQGLSPAMESALISHYGSPESSDCNIEAIE